MTTMEEIAKGLPSALKGASLKALHGDPLAAKSWAYNKKAANEAGKAKAFYTNQVRNTPRHLRPGSPASLMAGHHGNQGQVAARAGRRQMGIKQFELEGSSAPKSTYVVKPHTRGAR